MSGIHRSALFWILLCAGCHERNATRLECEQIIDHLIRIELKELGYQDPELTLRWQNKLKKQYRAQIDECVGKSINENAMQCIEQSINSEQVSHDCLH